VVGKSSFSDCLRTLKKDWILLLGNPGLSQWLRGFWASRAGEKKVAGGMVSYRAEDLVFLRGLVEAGKSRSVIDRCYPLERTAEAHRCVDTGQKTGSVVITLEPDAGD
jgi:NADPH:quinone reductase-like Zn-dependent oxidoreductase